MSQNSESRKRLARTVEFISTGGGSFLDKKESDISRSDSELMREIHKENEELREALRKHWTYNQYLRSRELIEDS